VTGHLEALWQALPEMSLAPVAEISAPPVPHVRLGVARDQAFCFYYPENLEGLRHFGAEIVEFSPLTDPRLLTSLESVWGILKPCR
jgi:cobyrinic acid a,c-diamide synthase